MAATCLRAIVLIVLDCLRADHVSAYGYHRRTTPTIDSLADRGIVWEQAHTLSSWTKPAVTSLLTGLYPCQHGVFHGVKRRNRLSAARTDALQSLRPTLAESFTAAGWRCGAFINNAQLSEFTRLDRGFERYVPNAGKADRLIELFENWLPADPHRPAFAYLHFLETHWPYRPRRRHIALFGGNRDANLFRDFSARDYGRLRRALSRGERTLSESDVEQMVQMYDGAVRRLDGKVKVVLRLLERLNIRDQTAIFVTADHGEEFLDHGSIGHGHTLYDELTHVPLIAWVPDGPAGIRRPEPVSLVDLPATLLDAAGIPHELGVTNLLGDGSAISEVCAELYLRSRYLQTLRKGHWKLHRRFKLPPPPEADPVASATPTLRQRVEASSGATGFELYDIARDPHERTNLAGDAAHQAVHEAMLARLDRWWESGAVLDAHPADVEIDERAVQRLRDLGYID